MDSAHFEALNKLYHSAAGYMGKTWRRSIDQNMQALAEEFRNLSRMNAENLEAVVQAEQREKGLNEKIRELEEAIQKKSSGDTVIVEKQIDTVYDGSTDTVKEVEVVTDVTVIAGTEESKPE